MVLLKQTLVVLSDSKLGATYNYFHLFTEKTCMLPETCYYIQTLTEGNKMRTESAKAASIIRKELKANGLNVTVKSKNYSGGNSIDVTIHKDLTPAGVKEVTAYCDQFEMGHFDGMRDLYEYSNTRNDIPQVKFVFVHVDYSDEIHQASRDYIDEINGIEENQKDRYYWMALNGSWGDFWKTQKPRIRVAA